MDAPEPALESAASGIAWISQIRAAELLGNIPPGQVARLASEGRIRKLEVPGCFTRYACIDILNLAALAVTPLAPGPTR